jgi:hypothetical protein
VFQRRLPLNGQHLFQLMLRGYGNDANSGIVKDVGSLLRGLCGINRNGDCAESKGREIRDRPLGPIFAEDGDAIALSDPPGLKGASHAHDAAVKLCGRDRRPALDIALHHDAVAAPAADCRENVV